MPPLGEILLTAIGGQVLSVLLNYVKDMFSTGLVDAAIRRTAGRLPQYPALDHTLRTWAGRQEVQSALAAFMARADLPPVRTLCDGLVDSGFSPPSDPNLLSAEGILTVFVHDLEEVILHSKHAPAYSHRTSVSEHAEIRADIAEVKQLVKGGFPGQTHVLMRTTVKGDFPGQTHVLMRTHEDDPPVEFFPVRTLLQSQKPRTARSTLEALRKHFGPSTEARAWYFYHSFSGWCDIQERRIPEARTQFTQAATYWEDRAAAQRNIGVTELMLGNLDAAQERADKALSLDPNDTDSVTLKAQIVCVRTGAQEAAAYVEHSPLGDKERNRLWGFVFHNTRDWTTALTHLRLGLKAFPDDHELLFVLCSTIGALISEEISTKEDVPPWVVCWTRRPLLDEAISAADRASELLRGQEELTTDLDVAYGLSASLKSLAGRYEEAGRDLDKIVDAGSGESGALVRVLQTESRLGRFTEAVAHAHQLLDRAGACDGEKRTYAEEIIAVHSPEQENNTGRQGIDRKLLSWEERLLQGRKAIAGGEWKLAQERLEPVVTPCAPRDLVKMYLVAALNGSCYDKCLAFVASCRESRVADEFILDVEIRLLENLGDLDGALDAVSRAEELGGEGTRWRLRRAVIERRRTDLGNAMRLLPEVSELKALELEDQRFAISLLIESERYHDALTIAYHCLQNNFEDSDAHLAYVQVFLERQPEDVPFLEVESAQTDTVVAYELSTGEKREILLAANGQVSGIDRLSDRMELFKRLNGKRAGDKVCIHSDEFGMLTAAVISVKHKLVWTFQDCMSRFNERFPGTPGMRKVQIEGSDITPILQLVGHVAEQEKRLADMCQQGRIPISAVAKLSGAQDHEIFFRMARGEFGGVLACDGDAAHLAEESERVTGTNTLCLEMTSVYTLAAMGALQILPQMVSQLCVSRFVIDRLKGDIAEKKQLQKHGAMSLGLRDGRPVVFESDESQMHRFVQSHEEILGWLLANCVICRREANLHQTLRRLEGAITDVTLATLALVSDSDAVLLSEDLCLRRLAASELNRGGAWSLALLEAAKVKGVWDGDLEETKVSLLHSNYRFLPLNAITLVTAHKLDNYSVGQNVGTVLRTVSDSRMYPVVAAQIVVDAVRHAWIHLPNSLQRAAFVVACAESLVKRGNWIKERQLVFALFRDRFRLLPLQLQEILMLIEGWEAGRPF